MPLALVPLIRKGYYIKLLFIHCLYNMKSLICYNLLNTFSICLFKTSFQNNCSKSLFKTSFQNIFLKHLFKTSFQNIILKCLSKTSFQNIFPKHLFKHLYICNRIYRPFGLVPSDFPSKKHLTDCSCFYLLSENLTFKFSKSVCKK